MEGVQISVPDDEVEETGVGVPDWLVGLVDVRLAEL